ncbi:MAG: carboxypeptidase regulatory-like domain-containing protein [Candidatus Korobacteraceae bacterium]
MTKWGRLGFLLLAASCVSWAQPEAVSGKVIVQQSGKPVRSAAGVVVWLTPTKGEAPKPQEKVFRLVQKNKHFSPHLLVVPVGSAVLFPNEDPFFHNVFSVYEGTRFDLGLYESGSSKEVRFTRPGPSYIFCNIHPEMSAVIMVMTTPYYATTDAAGGYSIADVPPGEYEFSAWYENAQLEQLKQLQHRVTITTSNARLEPVTLQAAPSLAVNHKNKFGQDYEKQPSYPFP